MEGIVLPYNSWARILFDPGATQSFPRTPYATNLGLELGHLEYVLSIEMPMGEWLDTKRMCRGCALRIGEQELIVDMVALDMNG